MFARTQSYTKPSRRYSFQPDYIVDTVSGIDFEYLTKHGIKAALIDLDGTVVARGAYDVLPAISAHLAKQSIQLYIATNRPRSRSLKNLKELLNAQGVIHPKGVFGKPHPRYYRQAAEEHGLSPESCVMIGDRFIQDIFGANAAGFATIAVHKLDRPTNAIDTVVSAIERRYTQRLLSSYFPLAG